MTVDISGSVCQSSALPVFGLCVVPERQEGEHVPHYSSHHCPVQHHHQLGHWVPALPALHFLSCASDVSSTEGLHHREVDQSSTGGFYEPMMVLFSEDLSHMTP